MNFKQILEDIKFARNLPNDKFYDLSQKVFLMDKVLERFETELSKINFADTLIWFDASKVLPSYDFDCIVKFEESPHMIYVAQYKDSKWFLCGQDFETIYKVKSWSMFPDESNSTERF